MEIEDFKFKREDFNCKCVNGVKVVVCFICDCYANVGGKKAEKMFFRFFYGMVNPPRIAYNTLTGEAGKGGMGLNDVKQRKNSLRVKIIKKYLDEGSKTAWKKTMKYF